jgi:hypothetical protein
MAYAMTCHALYEDVHEARCLAHQRIPLQWTAYMATDAQSCAFGYTAVYLDAGIWQAHMPDQYDGHVITVYTHPDRRYQLALSGTFESPRVSLTEVLSIRTPHGVLPIVNRCEDMAKTTPQEKQIVVNRFAIDMRTLATVSKSVYSSPSAPRP